MAMLRCAGGCAGAERCTHVAAHQQWRSSQSGPLKAFHAVRANAPRVCSHPLPLQLGMWGLQVPIHPSGSAKQTHTLQERVRAHCPVLQPTQGEAASVLGGFSKWERRGAQLVV